VKGRSIWNKPSTKAFGVYRLLLKHNGRARWKNLKTDAKEELRIGPTTLKKTFDKEMGEKPPRIRRDTVAGVKGPEIWYSLTQEGKREIVNSIVGDHAEAINVLKEVFATMDPVEAHVILGELKQSLLNVVTFANDIYSLLPSNAELVASTETEEKRKTRKESYRKTGGKVQVSILEKRRF
jgi:hypothetical protein